jgi:hypothetical protein
MTLDFWQSTPLPTQHIVWATVAKWATVWVVCPSGFKALPSTPNHPPPHLSTWLCSPLHLPHLTSRHLGTLSLTSVCVLWHLIYPSPDLGSLFDVPWTALVRGSENWSEANLFSMTSRAYCALSSGEVKDPSIRSDHGCNSWQILGNWLSSLNQSRMRVHIITGVAHLAGILIPAKNRAVSTPHKRTDTWVFQPDRARNLGKMNRQPPRTVSVEEHDELVSTVQTLQLQLRALSTQVLSITEITIQHRSEQQRNKDECEALRQQIEALQFVVGPASPTPSPNTFISDEASSLGPRPQLDLNLRPPTEADFPAPDHTKI